VHFYCSILIVVQNLSCFLFLFNHVLDQPLSEAARFQEESRFKPPSEPPSSAVLQDILTRAWDNTSYILKKGEEIGAKLFKECSPDEKLYFDTFVKVSPADALQLCIKTIDQCCEEWERARRVRMTGSVCYSLFTYSKNKKPDWPKKIENVYDSDFAMNTLNEA